MSHNKAKNKYIRRTRISERQFREILKEFCRDTDATETSDRVCVSRQTINRIYGTIRRRIVMICEGETLFSGNVEIDESYFGARRVRGKRGRGVGGKTPVVGLLKRDGKVYTKIIKDCSRTSLMPIIKGKVLEESSIYTDGWNAYDGLVTFGYKHRRIHHSKDEFARGKNHINGIESFWSFAKRRLRKFNGVPRSTFLLHLTLFMSEYFTK
jgi:transposase